MNLYIVRVQCGFQDVNTSATANPFTAGFHGVFVQRKSRRAPSMFIDVTESAM